MATTTKFTFKGFTFVVVCRDDGTCLYRDAAHLGGPLSNAAASIADKSVHRDFRRFLKAAVDRLTKSA